ncbi:MAG TPA: hypothetical protein VJ768_05155, partial [Anaerolineales bacterium]|nr:hypothetical protein [Anaerolineales bacterium]
MRIPDSGPVRRFAPYLLLLLPLLFYLPSLLGFPYPAADAEFSDIAITHLPNYIFLKNSLLNGVVPLWSPLLFSGTPFAANPLSGLWYPPGWLALLFSPLIGFSLVVMIHIVWGGLGMALLLRSQGLSLWASLFGALAFEALPKLIAHFGAGHLTILYALPWFPWLIWLSARPRSS